MTLAALTPAGRWVKGSALTASYLSARSVELPNASQGINRFDGSTVRAATPRPASPSTATGPPVSVRSGEPRATLHICDECGGPIMGRKPNCTFCSTCACEREIEHASIRHERKWRATIANPPLHQRRLERRRIREFDRRLDDWTYRLLGNKRTAAAQHRHHLDLQRNRDCARCGLRLGVKYVGRSGHRRLSPRRLHTVCAHLRHLERCARTNARNRAKRDVVRLSVAT